MTVTAAYAHKIAKVTIMGTAFGSQEIWNTGFFLGAPDADVASVEAPAAQAVATAWQTFFTTATSAISAQYKTTQVKVALLNTNGKTDLDNIDYYTYPAPISGGGAATVLPAQIALVATMTSDLQRGLASKGRMYLPGVYALPDAATGKIGAATVGNIATALKTMFDTINADINAAGTLILASKGRKTMVDSPNPGDVTYGGGVNALVTGLRVGDVFDTQRRRRDALSETYTSRVLA